MHRLRILATSILLSVTLMIPTTISSGKEVPEPLTNIVEYEFDSSRLAKATIATPLSTEEELLMEAPAISIPDEDIELLALLAMGEAEGETELGQRLVIDSVLNRVDDERFPNTIEDVIYQPNAYSCMWDGRIERCEVTEEMRQLVREELASRTNNDVIFFRTNHYSIYGEPMFVEGRHYFSSY